MPQSRSERLPDALYACALLGVAGIVMREAGTLAPAPFDPLGPKTFPLWICYGLIGLALLMLARLAMGLDLGRAQQSMVLGLEGGEGGHARRPLLSLGLFGLTGAYAAALSLRGVGFLVATGLFIFLSGCLLSGFRRSKLVPVLGLAVGAALVTDLVFRRLFALDLP